MILQNKMYLQILAHLGQWQSLRGRGPDSGFKFQPLQLRAAWRPPYYSTGFKLSKTRLGVTGPGMRSLSMFRP
jgi:hypothetical protein